MEGECEMSQSRDLGGLKGRHLQRERDGMGRWGSGHSQIHGGGEGEEEGNATSDGEVYEENGGNGQGVTHAHARARARAHTHTQAHTQQIKKRETWRECARVESKRRSDKREASTMEANKENPSGGINQRSASPSSCTFSPLY